MRASHVLNHHRQQLRAVAEVYKDKGITNLRVIGSIADGTDTEISDIDFLVDAEKNVSLFIIGALYSDLEDIVQRKIDLLIADEIPKYFKSKVLSKAVAI